MTKYAIQLLTSFIFLFISSIATWYEGSEILEKPWEWENTAHFSQLADGEVTKASEISQLDYFVYAAKEKPFFPFIMVLSFLYLIILCGKMSLKNNNKGFNLFLNIYGVILLLLGLYFISSPTMGGLVFSLTFIFAGLVSLVYSVGVHLRNLKK